MLGTLVTDWGRETSLIQEIFRSQEPLCFYEASGRFSHPRSAHGLQYWLNCKYLFMNPLIIVRSMEWSKHFYGFYIIFSNIFISKIDLSFLNINKRNLFSIKSHFVKKKKEIFFFIHFCFSCWNDIALPLWNSIAVKQICSVQIDAIWEFQI